MNAPWRYIADDGVSGSFGLAADEFLMGGYADGQPRPPTLRLYTYRSHCVLVGRFQNVVAEVNLCFGGSLPGLPQQGVGPPAAPTESGRRQGEEVPLRATQGVELNRRPTGGGTVIMGEGQLGVALIAPALHPPQEAFLTYSRGILEGLSSLGIQAQFRPKNDLEVKGKKIAGMGVYGNEGALLFHTSLMVDMDVALMLSLLNLPREKLSDKDVAAFEERLTTVRRETGLSLSVPQVRQAVKAGFERAFGVSMIETPFTPQELEGIRLLEAEKYLTPEWVFQRLPTPDLTGSSLRKTRGGLLRVYVALAGEVFKSVLITGDFFAPAPAITHLEARLKWSAATREEVLEAVNAELSDGEVPYLSPEALTDALMEAVRDARGKS